MPRYLLLTLKAASIPFAFCVLIGLIAFFLAPLEAVQLTAEAEVALFGVKIAVIALAIPYITESIRSFYEDIKLFKPEHRPSVVRYYRTPLGMLFTTLLFTVISSLLDCIYWLTLCRTVWNASLATFVAGITALVLFSLLILIRTIGEMETIKIATKISGQDEEVKGEPIGNGVPPLPMITSVVPEEGETGKEYTIQVSGGNLSSPAEVRLRRADPTNIMATNVQVVNDSQIICTFDLKEQPSGKWDLIVVNEDGGEGWIPEVFEVKEKSP